MVPIHDSLAANTPTPVVLAGSPPCSRSARPTSGVAFQAVLAPPRPPTMDPSGDPRPPSGAPEEVVSGGPLDDGREGAARQERREVDHDLVRRAQAGEEAAFAALVERHEVRAMRVAWGLVANREDARDLAQEAFLRVFRSLERFDFQHDFTTWLYRIVTNLSIDHLRKKRPALSTTPVDDEAPGFELEDEGAPSPAAGLESAETAEQVRACIDALPDHFRSVLMLRELEGLSCKRIADVVGATQVTVRWRLHRGRKLFQDEWERRARIESGPARAATDALED